MAKRILIIEDDGKLIEEAQNILDMGYTEELCLVGEKLMPEFNLKYDLIPLELPRVLDINYWDSLAIKQEDCVVLDLNYGNYMDLKTQKCVKVIFNGRDVLNLLAWNKANGKQVSNLEKVLIATSLPLEVDPANPHPDIALVSGFDVYGLEKGRDKKGNIVNYGSSLLDKLDHIYDWILFSREDREVPLNQGWREEGDVVSYPKLKK